MLCLCVCERDRVSCCSHYFFNQEPAVHTYGLLLLLMKWGKEAMNSGGFGRGRDKARALDVLQGIITEVDRQGNTSADSAANRGATKWLDGILDLAH